MPPKRKPSERQSKRQRMDQTLQENATTEAISAAVTAKVLENLKENGILPQSRQTRPIPVEMDVHVHEGDSSIINSISTGEPTQSLSHTTQTPSYSRENVSSFGTHYTQNMVQIPAQSLVAGLNKVNHGTATYKPIGRPLYNKINSKLQEKIKNKEVIDMSDILVDHHPAELDFHLAVQNKRVEQFFENSPSCSTQTVLSSRSIPATELLEYVKILANAALAPSTQATYSRAWKTFDSFCTEMMNQRLQTPLCVATISLFIAYMFKKSYAPSTISTYLSAIAYVRKMMSMPDNTQSFLVEKLVTGTYRLSKTFDSRLPITIPILNKLLRSITLVDKCIHVYDQVLFKAIFLSAFSTFFRV
ncbi:unnamed protein product [Mytilus coruscus]|uniref:Uncharacterized protein n=1 Tax=Mytilus coruscus TaxID=42192 RepID=A0A6J8B0W8_MYTCO|nr:unnamed protein product [Mytilus coruscus]